MTTRHLDRLDRSIPNCRLFAGALVLAVAAGVVVSGPLAAQSDSLFQGFTLVDDFFLEVDGSEDKTAEVYFQRSIPAYLVLPTGVNSPLLIVPRSRAVQSVNLMKVTKQADGTLDLAADAAFASKGAFQLDGTTVRFDADGKSYALKDKPPLLGLHPAKGLEEYSKNYVTLAKSYTPSAEAMKAIASDDRDVHVRVYFGSWCPFCKRYLPRLVRVANDNTNSKVKIDFYGLPTGISSDSVARQMNIKSVPTGVVFVDGKEVGRLSQNDWETPERAISQLLRR